MSRARFTEVHNDTYGFDVMPVVRRLHSSIIFLN
ncbi:unnamed protein product [Brassica oleracea var. botrytis]